MSMAGPGGTGRSGEEGMTGYRPSRRWGHNVGVQNHVLVGRSNTRVGFIGPKCRRKGASRQCAPSPSPGHHARWLSSRSLARGPQRPTFSAASAFCSGYFSLIWAQLSCELQSLRIKSTTSALGTRTCGPSHSATPTLACTHRTCACTNFT